MFARERSQVKDLCAGILALHESSRVIRGWLLRNSTVTVEWPNSQEDVKNHLTDSIDTFWHRVIAHDLCFSGDYPDGAGLILPINPATGAILSMASMHVPRQMYDGIGFPVASPEPYRRLIAELEHARENPHLVAVVNPSR